MSTWRGSWLLLRYEWRINRLGSLGTFFMATYIAVVTFPLYEAAEFPNKPFLTGVLDFVMLCVVPCFGFFMNQHTFRNMKEDYTARKLAAMRALPITVKQIAGGRLLSAMFLLVPVWLYFFVLMYLLSGWFREKSWDQLLNYALFWLGYAVFMSVVYLIMEFGLTGRHYFLLCFGCLPVFVVVVLLYRLFGQSLVGDLLTAAGAGNWWPTLGSMLAAAASVAWGIRLLIRIVARRSLLG
ncbi:ABC-2 transporter permease [Paenibacillus hamazuiensis]|uniref:ABC-2 transporter permease n=1 Tax=Paenibacillus hamazuiensis TaxID=2936508 RepID=UPI00200CC6E6|nr:ABC-2 transporter permease [Paenibacillus hamazuiensis]